MKKILMFPLKVISFIVEIPAVIIIGIGTIIWALSLIIKDPKEAIKIIIKMIKNENVER